MKTKLGRTFSLLWTAQGMSLIGTQISTVVIPLFAVSELGFSAFQLGILISLEGIATVVFGLFSGVVADRFNRRTLLISCDFARFLILILVPFLQWLQILNAQALYLIIFGVFSVSVFFDTAFWSYVPTVIEKSELVRGNGWFAMNQSIAETVGPGVAGSVMAMVGAPGAVLIDALSYLWSFLMIILVRERPEGLQKKSVDDHIILSLTNGFVFLFKNRLLVLIALGGVIWHIVYFALLPGLYLWFQRDIGASAFQIGLVLSGLGIGAILCAPLTRLLSERFGPLPVLVVAQLIATAAILLIPVAKSSSTADLCVVAGALAILGGSSTIASVMQMTVRQEITPKPLMGRIMAAVRLIVYGSMPIGSLAGGLLFGELPYRTAFLVLGIAGVTVTAIWGAAFLHRSTRALYAFGLTETTNQ